MARAASRRSRRSNAATDGWSNGCRRWAPEWPGCRDVRGTRAICRVTTQGKQPQSSHEIAEIFRVLCALCACFSQVGMPGEMPALDSVSRLGYLLPREEAFRMRGARAGGVARPCTD